MASRPTTPGYRPGELRPLLAPWRLHFVPTCSSTSTLAARLRGAGRLFAPAVVLAARQTAGRGRGGNRWLSDAGTLTATFAWPVGSEPPPANVPLLAGMAVRDAAAELLGGLPVSVQIKWPNDVLADERKLAGLLCERVYGVDLIGVGLNVSTAAETLASAAGRTARGATSLELCGRQVTRSRALLCVAKHLAAALSGGEHWKSLLRRFDRHHVLVGRRVRVSVSEGRAVEGVCRGLDNVGRLLIELDGRLEHVISGQVEAW